VIVALYLRAFRSAEPSLVAVGLCILATVAIMTVTNKTLSPQYLLWMGGPMAALLVFRRSSSRQEARTVGRLAAQLLVLAQVDGRRRPGSEALDDPVAVSVGRHAAEPTDPGPGESRTENRGCASFPDQRGSSPWEG